MTNKLSAKFLEIFRNLKSDAVPRAPRNDLNESTSEAEANNENTNFNQEEIFVEQDNRKKEKKKPNYKKSFSAPPQENSKFNEEEEDRRTSSANNNVNTQASGNVINIVNSNHVRCGPEYVYYMGSVHGHPAHPTTPNMDDEEPIEKTNIIKLLMDSNCKPEHEHIDYISKNLGKNWYRFFRKLNYTQGQIETAEYDMAKQGVAEARYKLLLDWVRNDDDGTLGKLANALWVHGERQIVKELAAIYNKNK